MCINEGKTFFDLHIIIFVTMIQEIMERSKTMGKVSIQGCSGMYSGAEFLVEGNQIIGRDSSRSQIVFPATSAAVSGQHCVVEVKADGIELADLGSTNGTFLENGTRLQEGKSVMLKNGEKFYLGSRENMFQVLVQTEEAPSIVPMESGNIPGDTEKMEDFTSKNRNSATGSKPSGVQLNQKQSNAISIAALLLIASIVFAVIMGIQYYSISEELQVAQNGLEDMLHPGVIKSTGKALFDIFKIIK